MQVIGDKHLLCCVVKRFSNKVFFNCTSIFSYFLALYPLFNEIGSCWPSPGES